MSRTVEEEVARISKAGSLEFAMEEIFYFAPVPFDPTCVAAVRSGVKKLGYDAREMITGAGHDACFIAKAAPTSMVFIPCIGGVSHNEEEDIKPEWAHAGANVMLHAIVEKAGSA
jgi:N-carbamoyl-L-amino-acid hydrolase